MGEVFTWWRRDGVHWRFILLFVTGGYVRSVSSAVTDSWSTCLFIGKFACSPVFKYSCILKGCSYFYKVAFLHFLFISFILALFLAYFAFVFWSSRFHPALRSTSSSPVNTVRGPCFCPPCTVLSCYYRALPPAGALFADGAVGCCVGPVTVRRPSYDRGSPAPGRLGRRDSLHDGYLGLDGKSCG